MIKSSWLEAMLNVRVEYITWYQNRQHHHVSQSWSFYGNPETKSIQFLTKSCSRPKEIQIVSNFKPVSHCDKPKYICYVIFSLLFNDFLRCNAFLTIQC